MSDTRATPSADAYDLQDEITAALDEMQNTINDLDVICQVSNYAEYPDKYAELKNQIEGVGILFDELLKVEQSEQKEGE